jgi:predicted 2-oxoglutarate/Fe(II)-dependent dioxygenase YbiX
MELVNLAKVLHNVLTPNECDSIINEFEKRKITAKAEESTNLEGYQATGTSKIVYLKQTSEHYNFLLEKMNFCLWQWISHLEQYNFVLIPTLKHTLRYPHIIRILRYNKGEYVHEHSDWGPFTHASVVLNLNSDYEGGEFSFFHKKYNFQLKQGDALIFPADVFWTHEVTPVTSGVRYSVNSFIQSFPNDIVKKIEKEYHYWKKDREREFKF